jgi:DNA-binding CsgD family transcriptional regulator
MPESPAAVAVAESTNDDATRLKRLLDLSNRQMAILAGICRGEPNKIIGRTLNLPESTVKVHVREIMRKLAVSNRTQVAIAFARLSQPISAVSTSARKIVNSPADASPGGALVCDVITLVPPPSAKLAGEADGRSDVGNLTSGRFSRTR